MLCHRVREHRLKPEDTAGSFPGSWHREKLLERAELRQEVLGQTRRICESRESLRKQGSLYAEPDERRSWLQQLGASPGQASWGS